MVKQIKDYNFALATGLDREIALRIFSDAFVDNGSNAVLFGETGTGKTHIADALVAKVKERGKTAYKLDGNTVVDTANLYEVQEFPAIENGKYNPKRKLLKQLTDCDLLIIDGLPTNFGLGDGRVTAEVLRNRFKARKSTFICSQGRPENWVKGNLFGRYTTHVLAEVNLGFYFDVTDPDHPEIAERINPPSDMYTAIGHQLGLSRLSNFFDQLRQSDEVTEQEISNLMELYNLCEPFRDWHVLFIVGRNLTHESNIPDRRQLWAEKNKKWRSTNAIA